MRDEKIYKFVHKDLGIQYLTRQRLRDKYNLRYKSLSKVIYGERNHTGGWHLNEIKGPEKYKFIHKDLGIEILTRHQLADKYDLSLLSVSRVIQGRRNHTKGWHLNELQPLWGSTVYKFWHKKHGIEELAQYELANKYNLTSKGVSNIVQGKACSTKGWYLKKEYTQEDLLIAWENFTKLMEPK